MDTIQHAVLTGMDLHEPKNIETASDGEVYVANGAGSGEWKPPYDGSAGGYTSGCICVYLDPMGTVLPATGGAIEILSEDCSVSIYKDFVWDNSTSELSYIGNGNVVSSFGILLGIRNDDTVEESSVDFYLDLYHGAGWMSIPQTKMSLHVMPGEEVSVGTMLVPRFRQGWKVRPMYKTTSGASLVLTNFLMNVNAVFCDDTVNVEMLP